jgi:hypothetical protein
MGRGRAKAKQTKVARRLKYEAGPNTDLDALRNELGASAAGDDDVTDADSDDEQDEYADLYSKYDDEDDEAAEG